MKLRVLSRDETFDALHRFGYRLEAEMSLSTVCIAPHPFGDPASLLRGVPLCVDTSLRAPGRSPYAGLPLREWATPRPDA